MFQRKAKQLKDGDLYEYRYRYKERRATVRFYAILALIILLIFSFRLWWTGNFACVIVDGRSMWPTLQNGERLLMKYGEEAERGDIIVVDVSEYVENYDANDPFYLRPFEKGTKLLIKRLIALEGDTVKCEDGQVYIKYEGANEFVKYTEEPDGLADRFNCNFSEYTVGEGEIFFLGDNRTGSLDDRFHEEDGSNSHIRALYKESDIYGVVSDWAYENRSSIDVIFTIQEFFAGIAQWLFG